MNNRRGFARDIIRSFGWKSISKHYRDKSGCIIYLSDDLSDIYIDLPWEEGTLSSDDSKNSGTKYYKGTPLLYMMADYLRITKVVLRKNKRARRWLNRIIKNTFRYAGKLFKEYFLPDGTVNWTLLMQACEITLDDLVFIMKCDGIDWKGYDPLWNCKEYQENK